MINLFAAAALAAALGACATYTTRPVAPAAVQAQFERRSLADPALSRWLDSHAPAASGRWNLDRLTWTSLFYNADIRVAQARWKAARAAAITAGARPNPQLDASFEYNRDAGPGEEAWTRGLSLGIPLETGGKRSARIAAAIARAEQARLDLAEAAWARRQQVRLALVGLLAPAAALQAQAAAQEGRLRLMQRRIELGLAGRPDLTQLRLVSQATAAEAADARRDVHESRTALAAAVGVPVGALASVRIDLDDVEQPVPPDRLPAVTLQREALLHRPDVLAALAGYQAAEGDLRLEIARQYPDVTLGPGLLWDAGAAKWTLGLSLALPLLDRNRGRIAEARAHREEAAAQVLKVQADALAELEQSRATYAASLDALRAAQAQVDNAHALVGVAQRALAAGTGTRSEVLGAEAELAAAQARRQRALMQAQKDLGTVEDAMRMPVQGPPFAPADAVDSIPGDTGR